MDKILEKLGIYDLVAVLLTGMIILLLSHNILLFYSIEIKADETIQFLILSYFIGMLFQEIGNKMINKKILKMVFDGDQADYHISLLPKEVDLIKQTVAFKINVDVSSLSIIEIYTYCKKIYVDSSNGLAEIDKQQSIGGMARSLFVYFIMTACFLTIRLLICLDIITVLLLIVSLLFARIFYQRYIRFYRRRYVHILRSYYYNNISQ